MPTFLDVGREVIGSIQTDCSAVLASRWAARRYQQMASRTRFRHLRKLGEIILPGAIDDGTVTATRGSRTVTGDATAQAAWLSASSIVGRFLRVATAWYRIAALNAGTITLESAYSEETSTSVAYKIVERYVKLSPRVKWLGDSFVHFRMRRPLLRMSQAELMLKAPERQLVGTPPLIWSEAEEGLDADGKKVRQIEFYPIDSTDELLYFPYWDEPPLHDATDELPKAMDTYVLVEGALIDLFRYEMSKALQKGQAEVAGTWRNEARTQATSWEKNILEAIRSDRGSDDIQFILSTLGGSNFVGSGDIVTARDEIFARGNRP